MSLTMAPGPLAADAPDTVNYEIDGPAHRLLFHEFPRRVRAELGGQTVLDTQRGRLLHETALLPVLYVPLDDVDQALLEPTEHTTHCPFKGDASYWTVRANGSVAENAVWGYPDPKPAAAWLQDHVALYWEKMDAWYDEDERVEGHLRDPYHRVDARRSSRHVRVLAGDDVVAESTRPVLVDETALPFRWYLPREDVRAELLPSETTSVCPYKGRASYWSLRLGDRTIADAGWSYEDPLPEALPARGYVCLDLSDDLTTEAN